jgi:uncharacterized protein YqgQ
MKINKIVKDISELHQDLLERSEEFLNLHLILKKELEHKFKENYIVNKENLDDLEKFYKIIQLCKKNGEIANNMYFLLKRKFNNLGIVEDIEE